MPRDEQGRSHRATSAALGVGVLGAVLVVFGARCGGSAQIRSEQGRPVVRIGVSEIELRQFFQNFTVESLARVGEDGRVTPRLARGWTVSPDRLSITIELRRDVSFHDGSSVTASLVAETLRRGLPDTMGPATEDVLSIEPIAEDKVEIKLSRPTPFALEALETVVRKPGAPAIGTGPFLANPSSPDELLANDKYYLGTPTVGRLDVKTYPTVRTAWAELLRDRLDMIYEVGSAARDSLESSTTIKLFPYIRHYQYLVLLNTRAPAIKSAAIRRALNTALDRTAFVRDALNGHGLASSGPVWPEHWAAHGALSTLSFDAQKAAAIISAAGTPVRFRCLVPAGNERLALVLKRQLEAVGVELVLEERPALEAQKAVVAGDFDAFLATAISGPSILRPYDWWHSKGSRNRGKYANANVDAALDAIRHAQSDDNYRAGVEAFQRSILDDPPAIFLAWDERARAVSRRFEIPSEAGVDIMGTLRLWRLTNVGASSN